MIDMQDQEVWSIAVFRLREAANRIFALATRVRAQHIRSRLLEVYQQLRSEESKLSALAETMHAAEDPTRVDSGGTERAEGGT